MPKITEVLSLSLSLKIIIINIISIGTRPTRQSAAAAALVVDDTRLPDTDIDADLKVGDLIKVYELGGPPEARYN